MHMQIWGWVSSAASLMTRSFDPFLSPFRSAALLPPALSRLVPMELSASPNTAGSEGGGQTSPITQTNGLVCISRCASFSVEQGEELPVGS